MLAFPPLREPELTRMPALPLATAGPCADDDVGMNYICDFHFEVNCDCQVEAVSNLCEGALKLVPAAPSRWP